MTPQARAAADAIRRAIELADHARDAAIAAHSAVERLPYDQHAAVLLEATVRRLASATTDATRAGARLDEMRMWAHDALVARIRSASGELQP